MSRHISSQAPEVQKMAMSMIGPRARARTEKEKRKENKENKIETKETLEPVTKKEAASHGQATCA